MKKERDDSRTETLFLRVSKISTNVYSTVNFFSTERNRCAPNYRLSLYVFTVLGL